MRRLNYLFYECESFISYFILSIILNCLISAQQIDISMKPPEGSPSNVFTAPSPSVRARAFAAPNGPNAIDEVEMEGEMKPFIKIGSVRDGIQKAIFDEASQGVPPDFDTNENHGRELAFGTYDDNNVVDPRRELPLFIPAPYRNETKEEKAATATTVASPTRLPPSSQLFTRRPLIAQEVSNRLPIPVWTTPRPLLPPNAPPQFVPQRPQQPQEIVRQQAQQFVPQQPQQFVPQQPQQFVSQRPQQPQQFVPQQSQQPSLQRPQQPLQLVPQQQPQFQLQQQSVFRPQPTPQFQQFVPQQSRPQPQQFVPRQPQPQPFAPKQSQQFVFQQPQPQQFRPHLQLQLQPQPQPQAQQPQPIVPQRRIATPFQPATPSQNNFAEQTPRRPQSENLRSEVCPFTIFYESTPAAPFDLHLTYSHFATVVSVDQCARTCHEFNCANALFDPNTRHCQFNPTTVFSVPQGTCPLWPNPLYRNNIPISGQPLRIFCITCQKRRRGGRRPVTFRTTNRSHFDQHTFSRSIANARAHGATLERPAAAIDQKILSEGLEFIDAPKGPDVEIGGLLSPDAMRTTVKPSAQFVVARSESDEAMGLRIPPPSPSDTITIVEDNFNNDVPILSGNIGSKVQDALVSRGELRILKLNKVKGSGLSSTNEEINVRDSIDTNLPNMDAFTSASRQRRNTKSADKNPTAAAGTVVASGTLAIRDAPSEKIHQNA